MRLRLLASFGEFVFDRVEAAADFGIECGDRFGLLAHDDAERGQDDTDDNEDQGLLRLVLKKWL